MAMVLHRFDDVDEQGQLLPGYLSPKTGWVKFDGKYTDEYVAGAIQAACEAGKLAEAKTIMEMAKGADGWVRDACGGAWVRITKPSRVLLNSLKRQDAVWPCHGSAWSFRRPQSCEQSITVLEDMAKAQCQSLRKAFPGQDIEWHSWVD